MVDSPNLQRHDALNTAISIAGGECKLSIALGLHKTAVYSWDQCPSDRVLSVCEIVDWQVTPNQLRPDLYPNAGDALPTTEG